MANFNEVNERRIKAQEKLVEVRSKLEAAKQKVKEIQNQSINKAEKEKINSQTETEQIIQKFEKLKKETLIFQQQKALKLLSKKMIQLSLKQVQEKFQNRVNLKFQTSINNFYIALLLSLN